MWTHDARRVVFGHHTDPVQGMGGYGVQLFFALSGILIAWRILDDEQKVGYFSAKAFYIRRFFRIQPTQWVYLGVVALLMGLHLIHAQWKYWWGALLMYENFLWHNLDRLHLVPASYLVGHFWSLAAEEHYYLLISLFFLFVKRRRTEMLGGLFVLVLALQFVGSHIRLFSLDVSDRRTYWLVQYLLFASFAAILLRYKPWAMTGAIRWLKPWTAFLLTIPVLYAHHLWRYHGHLCSPLLLPSMDPEWLFYSFSGWVVATMLHPESLTTRFLELKPLRFVGRISYSLYLWHLLFFGGGAAQWCSWRLLTWSNGQPYRYILAFVAAIFSYYCIERPMIRLGHRLAPPATPGHRDLAVGAAPAGELAAAV